MIRALAAIAVSLAPALALAQEPPKAGDLVAALSGDWNGDGQPDAALITQAEGGDAGLSLYLGDPVFGLKRVVDRPHVIFSGPMGGQTPALLPGSSSSFKLHQEQIGIGRTPWESTLSIAWRNGQFVLAGYSYQFYDRINPEHYGSCDVNLLAGNHELTLDGKTQKGRQDARAFPISQLDADYMPKICASLFQ
ncbi:hypothetical protein [Thioclava sp.]|uniref:hypothetical protein n=1 Tax=Thioclava sp. TaxID=1933450 RepID=UPI003AA839C6